MTGEIYVYGRIIKGEESRFQKRVKSVNYPKVVKVFVCVYYDSGSLE